MRSSNYLKTLLSVHHYTKGSSIQGLRSVVSNLYGKPDDNVFVFENGRVGEYIFLKSLKLPADSEIIIQGFTCNAVVNPILWLGLKPVYVDINRANYSLDLEDLNTKITSKTKVVIVQHTFGIPAFDTSAKFEEFVKSMNSRGILVFEDCAHALGGELEGRKLGTFGDATLLSFGIEKVLSTRVGGVLLVNNSNLVIDVSNVNQMGFFSTLRWLINPLIWRVLRNVGKTSTQINIAKILKNMGILNMGFEKSELTGNMPKTYPRFLPNALCDVVLQELNELDNNLAHRKIIVKNYLALLRDKIGERLVELPNSTENPLVRLPILCETENGRNELLSFLIENDVNVGNWYDPTIYPKGTEMKSMRYYSGTCKNAEKVSTEILNLPTGLYVSEKEVDRICNLIKLYFNSNGKDKN